MATGTIQAITTPFADMTTAIHSITTYNGSWTATEDCFYTAAMYAGTNTPAIITIDSVQVFAGALTSPTNGTIYPNQTMGYIKKGQVFKTRNSSATGYSIKFYRLLKT